MNRLSPIEAARWRHDLAAVARRTGIDVPRTSGSVSVRCPFPAHGHYDRSPSLRLHLEEGIFSCFGCGKRGDVVEWVREAEGVDWRAAIAILDSRQPVHNAWSSGAPTSDRARTRIAGENGTGARRASGESEYPDLSRTPPERVYQALEAAWRDYTYEPFHGRGVAYLAQRGIEVSVLENHTGRPAVGHSHTSSDGLVAALRARGFTDDEIVDAGLSYRRLGDSSMTDFYRERVLIPLRDGEDRICGFIGRNVGDERFAKYKNPPRTHAYDKSVNLYQPLSAPATGPSGQVVVVEGTLDAVAIAVAAIYSERAGQFCPVTQSGRELSPGQLDYVLGLHPYPPVIAFDGDAAGRESSERVARAATQRGDLVVVAALPDGHDPASWLAERGTAGLAVLIRGATENPAIRSPSVAPRRSPRRGQVPPSAVDEVPPPPDNLPSMGLVS